MKASNYSVVAQDRSPLITQSKIRRQRLGGLIEIIAGWYLVVLHFVASILFTYAVSTLDGRDYNVGTPAKRMDTSSGLYQTQVTALVSVGLVLMRLIAGSCSGLLAWRIIYLLLETRGLTIAELLRLSSYRAPVFLQTSSIKRIYWSMWAIITLLLLWPAAFAAPLASSSISWIPGFKMLNTVHNNTLKALESPDDVNFGLLAYESVQSMIGVSGLNFAAREPGYAFNTTSIPLRRHFSQTAPVLNGSAISITNGSTINITAPYIEIDLKWIDGEADATRAAQVNNVTRVDVLNQWYSRNEGTVYVVNNEPAKRWSNPPPERLSSKKLLVGVSLSQVLFNKTLNDDGTRANSSTPCSKAVPLFKYMPPELPYNKTNGDYLRNTFCYQMAEIEVTTGTYAAKDCSVAIAAGTNDAYATCYVDRDKSKLQSDYLSDLAMRFTGDVLKYAVELGYVGPFMDGNMTSYTISMLTLGYQAAWSSLMRKSTNGAVQRAITYRSPVPVVRAEVHMQRMYIWLALNAALTLAALLVAIAHVIAGKDTVNDTGLAALTMDLSAVSHGEGPSYLCNAVSLDSKQKKLPLMIWERASGGDRDHPDSLEHNCRRRVVFADRKTVDGDETFSLQTWRNSERLGSEQNLPTGV